MLSAEKTAMSRSGRVIKKSAKVIEMEETEKTSHTLVTNERSNNKIVDVHLVSSNGSKSLNDSDFSNSHKKRIKLKIPLPDKDFKDTVMMEGDDDGNSEDVEESAPSVSSSYSASNAASPSINIPSSSASFAKEERPSLKTKITIPEDHRKVKPLKISRKLIEGETSANKLFQQITSGTPHIDHRRKGFRRNEFNDKAIGNLDFGSDDENSDEPSLSIASNTQDYVAAAVAHAKTLKAQPKVTPVSEKRDSWRSKARTPSVKPSIEVRGRTEKKRRGPSITAYTLFSKENRTKVQQSNPNLDFANISRKLGKIWQSLPNKEKIQWKRRAQKISSQGAGDDFANKSPTSKDFLHSNTIPSRGIRSDSDMLTPVAKRKDSPSIDIATHLKLLGSSLTAISQKLNHNPSLPVSGSLSILLDSTLCAVGPLICLTRLMDPESFHNEVHEKIMENISYLMPGI